MLLVTDQFLNGSEKLEDENETRSYCVDVGYSRRFAGGSRPHSKSLKSLRILVMGGGSLIFARQNLHSRPKVRPPPYDRKPLSWYIYIYNGNVRNFSELRRADF